MSDEISQAIQSQGQQIDFIAEKVAGQDERLERIEQNMATKAEHQDVMNTLDKLVGLVEKTNQEVTMLSHGMRRQGDRIEAVEDDVKQMKPALGFK